MGAGAANAAVAAAILLAGTATVLLLVGLLSWWRVRQPRLVWVSLGFAALAAQGWLYVRQTVAQRGPIAAGIEPFPVLLALDLALVAFLYLAVLRR